MDREKGSTNSMVGRASGFHQLDGWRARWEGLAEKGFDGWKFHHSFTGFHQTLKSMCEEKGSTKLELLVRFQQARTNDSTKGYHQIRSWWTMGAVHKGEGGWTMRGGSTKFECLNNEGVPPTRGHYSNDWTSYSKFNDEQGQGFHQTRTNDWTTGVLKL